MKNLSFLLILIFVFAVKGYAQLNNTTPQAIDSARQRTMDEKLRSAEMDRARNELNADRIRATATNERFPEIKDDFERIQITNNQSLQTASIKETPDLRTISKAVVEIKKRALRLKSNLFPVSSKTDLSRENEQKEQDRFLKLELKPLAIQIDNAIYRLVSNNIFQNIKLVNLKDSEKAENDLEKIIFLCDVIGDKIKSTRKD